MFSHLRAFIWLPLNFKGEKFAKTIFLSKKIIVEHAWTLRRPVDCQSRFAIQKKSVFVILVFGRKKMLLSFSSWFCEYKGRNNPFLTTHTFIQKEKGRLLDYVFIIFLFLCRLTWTTVRLTTIWNSMFWTAVNYVWNVARNSDDCFSTSTF